MSSPYVSLLEALRAHCNLPEFPNPLPSNELLLQLENGLSISINLKEETSMVVLFAEIGTYELKNELSVLSKIAQANFLWAATEGGTLSARVEIQTVYIAYQAPISSLEADPFIKRVQKFARVAEQWKNILQQIDKGKNLEAPMTSTNEANSTPVIPDEII